MGSCASGTTRSWVSLMRLRLLLVLHAGRAGGDPDGDQDQEADAGDPRVEALRDGAERAEAEAAVRRRRLALLQVGDDVALRLRAQGGVGEDRHLLRAGDQRLVDVLGADPTQRGGEPAVRQRAAAAGEVVTGGAVGQEE